MSFSLPWAARSSWAARDQRIEPPLWRRSSEFLYVAPMQAEHSDVTVLLRAWQDGDAQAHQDLIGILYEELRQIARRHLRDEASGHTINTTALVHEAYLELVDSKGLRPQDRAHFLGAASRVMRHVLIDHARARSATKRGGDRVRVPLDDVIGSVAGWQPDLLDLDRALVRLADHDERMARIVECRFFGGMTLEETAEAIEVAPRTVRRSWTRARAYLFRELSDGPSPGEESGHPRPTDGPKRR